MSLKIRSISETPSLWNNVLWPWYDKREEKSLNAALEVCGTHVHRLVVPDIVSCCLQCHECDNLPSCYFSGLHMEVREEIFIMEPSVAMNMLRCCCNVTEITLGICLNGDEVKEIVEKMKHLRKLNICHIVHPCQVNQSLQLQVVAIWRSLFCAVTVLLKFMMLKSITCLNGWMWDFNPLT